MRNNISVQSLGRGLFRWENLAEGSPTAQTRNDWLYKYGAFCYDEEQDKQWYPCSLSGWSYNGEPYFVNPISDALQNSDSHIIFHQQLRSKVKLFRVFRDGMAIADYCGEFIIRLNNINKYIDILSAKASQPDLWVVPKTIESDFKQMLLASRSSSEPFVMGNSQLMMEDIKLIATPDPSSRLEALWTRYDYCVQEICAVLGLPYNPEQGKRERVVRAEISAEFSRLLPVINAMTNNLEQDIEDPEAVTHVGLDMIKLVSSGDSDIAALQSAEIIDAYGGDYGSTTALRRFSLPQYRDSGGVQLPLVRGSGDGLSV